MTTVDASIPLQVRQPQFGSPMQAYGQALTLKQLQANTELKNMELAIGMQTLRDQQELSRLGSASENIDPATGMFKPEALQMLTNPLLRQKLNQSRMQAMKEKAEIDWKTSETAQLADKRKTETLQTVMENAYSTYEDMRARTGNQQAAREAFDKVLAAGYEEIKATGKGGFPKDTQFKMLSPDDVHSKLILHKERRETEEKGQTPFTKETRYVEQLKGQLADLPAGDPRAASIRDQIVKVEKHIARMDAPPKYMVQTGEIAGKFGPLSSIEVRQKDGKFQRFEAQQNKTTGQWVTADERRAPIDVSSGFKKVKETDLGSRESVLLQRGITSALDAVADIENMAALPVKATTGLFGMGHEVVSPSFFAAPKRALLNKITPQEDQDLQVSIKGIGRALAGLATGGVYVNQAIVQQFDMLAAQPGDTYMTKLRKLATMRQNTDNGVDAMIANPRIGEEHKEQLKAIKDRLETAVPFLPKDVTAFQNNAKPDESFEQFAARTIKKTGEKKVEDAPPAMADRVPGQTKWRGHTWQKDGWH